MKFKYIILALFILQISCTGNSEKGKEEVSGSSTSDYYFDGMYVPVTLRSDLSVLTDNEKAMIPILIEAAEIMDELFWIESYGNKEELLGKLSDDKIKEFAVIN